VFYHGGPVAGPVGIAINPANDGVWIGDYGSTADGTAANDLLITPTGQLKATFTDTTTAGAASFVGVWGQGVSSSAGTVSFYYGNAGNATTGTGGGDVWRLTPHPAGPVNGQPVNSTYAQIATGQGETPAGGNATTAAGPQGFAFDATSGTLYETNDADNTLYAIPDAATATGPVTARIVYRGSQLNSPENVAIDPLNGDLLVVNANDNRLVEITPVGDVVGSRDLAKHQSAGALFGLATGTDAAGQPVLYYGNSDTNTLHELVLDTHRGL
jgi:DNA-binding beta-propeller fold protein YncE